jgi:DNA-binding response OmpR family regulator
MPVSGTRQEQILVVDDDPRVRDMLTRFLEDRGYAVHIAADGDEMWAQLRSRQTDLILLDLNFVDGKDGLDLVRDIRAQSDIPMMVLTGRNDVIDRIVGIEMGADDYVVKPFNLREVHARVKAILRRHAPKPRQLTPEDEVVRFHGWTLDLSRRKLCSAQGVDVGLSTGDFEMLTTLVRHPGRVLSREFLMDQTRAGRIEAFDRAIDTQIARLRKKIEIDSRHPQIIKSIRGVGYVFSAPVTHDVGLVKRRT